MKKSVFATLAVLFASFMFASCLTTKKADTFAGLYSEKPEVFLIMPPVNNSTNVEAKDYFYTTMNVPLAEAGYYVLPSAAVYATLQRESAYDAERFVEGDLKKFRQMFGADVAVFTVINSWEKALIGSAIVIEIEYIFRSTKSNETIFKRNATITCDTSTGLQGESFFGSLVVGILDAVKTAVSEYIDVAIKCNEGALSDLPAGKYSPKYGTDDQEDAMGTRISLRMSK
ncbi:MAG: DUF799 family lipoprotein [Treponema sp.]|nr:DUF799 family lipoprotein [Candidatus Treponema equifaecale]